MTEREKFAREALEAYIAANNNAEGRGGAAKACRLLDIHPTIMSQLRNDKYPGREDELWEQIAAHFELKQEAAATIYKSGGYVDIGTSEDMLAYLRYCHKKGGLMVITGDSGVGKTMAIRRYKEMYPENVVELTMRAGCGSLKPALMQLARALGIKERGKSVPTLCDDISERVRDGMLIIVDEAQHCKAQMVDNWRSYSDAFYKVGKTLGIAYVGNAFTADNFGGSQDSDMPQVGGRVIAHVVYEVKDVTMEDVRKLFCELAADEASLEFMHGITQGPQGIRGAMRVYEIAQDNGNTSYEGLVAAAKHKGLAIW